MSFFLQSAPSVGKVTAVVEFDEAGNFLAKSDGSGKNLARMLHAIALDIEGQLVHADAAPALTKVEAAEVRRFGLDHPEDDNVVHGTDGQPFGINWAAKSVGLRRDDLGDLQ